LVWLVLSKWFSLGYGSVMVRLYDAIEIITLRSCGLLSIY
jgi:hypothetical protein